MDSNARIVYVETWVFFKELAEAIGDEFNFTYSEDKGMNLYANRYCKGIPFATVKEEESIEGLDLRYLDLEGKFSEAVEKQINSLFIRYTYGFGSATRGRIP